MVPIIVNVLMDIGMDCTISLNNFLKRFYIPKRHQVDDNETQLCPNIDECAEGLHDCDHVCIDQIPAEHETEQPFTCECNTGYSTEDEGRTCQKIVVKIEATSELTAAQMEEFTKKQAELRAKQIEMETQKMKEAANIDVAALSPEAAEEAAGQMTSMLLKSLGGIAGMAKKEEDTEKDPMVAKVIITTDLSSILIITKYLVGSINNETFGSNECKETSSND